MPLCSNHRAHNLSVMCLAMFLFLRVGVPLLQNPDYMDQDWEHSWITLRKRHWKMDIRENTCRFKKKTIPRAGSKIHKLWGV